MSGLLVGDPAGGVLELTLDRPGQRNALTPDLIEELLVALERIDTDPAVRVVVLAGAGEAFCAGFDVTHLTSPGTPAAGAERDLVERLCTRLRGLRAVTVARVDGIASGGGCDLAVSCDVRFASDRSRFAMPPARLGILYSHQGIARLVALVGPAVARELLFGAEQIDARRALAIGLVNRVVPAAELRAETATFAAAVAANAPLAVAATKRVVDLVTGEQPLSAASAAAIEELARQVWASADAVEGPAAFRERRSPRFRGA
ncbi:MAG: enoyl-CoA hydratase/isomerase family protein [Thermoleophilia bacterium]|nr:enoyl-CoA hydratase/isomerase family protein [Thermoleophilia bacterium]